MRRAGAAVRAAARSMAARAHDLGNARARPGPDKARSRRPVGVATWTREVGVATSLLASRHGGG